MCLIKLPELTLCTEVADSFLDLGSKCNDATICTLFYFFLCIVPDEYLKATNSTVCMQSV